ncbi:hypothetical protein E8E11_003220 [Didymella keratinophila]|nr:hypothetical protein E8E11_003220 [Didymella keratinophila]
MTLHQAVMAPHLFTLPRELRDNIYQYLHRDLEKGYLVDFEGVRAQEAKVRIERAPLSSALLVHSRLYAEYQENANRTQDIFKFSGQVYLN